MNESKLVCNLKTELGYLMVRTALTFFNKKATYLDKKQSANKIFELFSFAKKKGIQIDDYVRHMDAIDKKYGGKISEGLFGLLYVYN